MDVKPRVAARAPDETPGFAGMTGRGNRREARQPSSPRKQGSMDVMTGPAPVIPAQAGISSLRLFRTPVAKAPDENGWRNYFVTTSVPFMIAEWPGKEQKNV
jgi:hypothetical protein